MEVGGGGEGGRGRQQSEGREVVVPVGRLAAEAAQLDHRQGEVEAVTLGPQHDLTVEIEARRVLRRRRRDQPAVVADGNEDADFHPVSTRGLIRTALQQLPCHLHWMHRYPSLTGVSSGFLRFPPILRSPNRPKPPSLS